MSTRSGNYPLAVLAYAQQIADLLDVRRGIVLSAAARAVLAAPPPHPVSYPTLNKAVRAAPVTLTKDEVAGVSLVADTRFYGRLAWLVYFGLVHRQTDIATRVRAEGNTPDVSKKLARRDETRHTPPTGGHPCLSSPPLLRPPAPR